PGGRVSLDKRHTRGAARQASRPSAPLPAKRSRQLVPDTRVPSQLNSVSRTRSGVGRIAGEGGKRNFLPRHLPPMMRSTRAWPARFGVTAERLPDFPVCAKQLGLFSGSLSSEERRVGRRRGL